MAEEHADELMVAHMDGRMRASHGQAPAQAAEGCTRSHPHENMDSACRAKAAIAEMQNMAARGAEATTHDLERFVAMLAAAPTTQPAPQQEAQEPVAWYVTGCSRLLDEAEAKAEARHIGGTARAIPLYTAPQPSPKADSQPAPANTRQIAECYGDCPTDPKTCANQCKFEGRAPHAPADSVTAPAAGAVAHTISDAQIEAMPVWRNFVGLWPESRREIVDAVVDLLAAAPTPPVQAADSVLEDAARYRWLREHRIIDLHANPSVPWVVRCEFQPIPTTTAIVGEALDAAIDVARKQGANHD